MMVIAAVRAPVVVGAKCPWTAQLAPAARLAPQVLPKMNEEVLAPVTAMLPMPNADVPVLVSVTLFEAVEAPTVSVPNARLVAERDTAVGVTPVPLRAMDWGEFVALSVRVTAAVRAPVVAGVKCP